MKKLARALVLTTLFATATFVATNFKCPMGMHGPWTWIAKTKTDIRAINSAVDLFLMDNYKYPESLDVDGFVGEYMQRIPRDFFGQAYIYRLADDQQSFMVYSIGENGIDEFGEGDDVARLDKRYKCPTYYRCDTACEKLNRFTFGVSIILWPITLIYLAGLGIFYGYRRYRNRFWEAIALWLNNQKKSR